MTSDIHTWIALAGHARVGKDTVADMLVEHHGFTKIGFADALKEAVWELNPMVELRMIDGALRAIRYRQVIDDLGPDGAKDVPEVRRLLQVMGTEVGREMIDPNLWIDLAFKKATRVANGRVVFSDCRFENEAWEVHRAGGVVIHIDRPGIGPVNDHTSDTVDWIDRWMAAGFLDHSLTNDGTLADLRADVDNRVRRLTP